MTADAEGGRFGRALLRSFSNQGLAGIFKVATTIVAGRYLSVDGFGAYSLATVLVLITFSIGNLGVASGTTYHLPRSEEPRAVVTTALHTGAFLGLLALAVSAIAVAGLRPVIGDIDLGLAFLALASLPAYFVVNAATGVFLGRQDYDSYNRAGIASFGLLFGATTAAVLVWRTAWAGIGAWTAAYWISAGVVAAVLLRANRPARPLVVPRLRRQMLTFGLKSHASTVVTFLSYRIDLLFVGALLTVGAAGRYAAAVALAESVWFFSQVASTLLFARVTAEEDATKRRRLADAVTRLTVGSSLFAAAAMSLLAEPLLSHLYSPSYADMAATLRVLMLGVVALSLSRMLANYMAAIGRPGVNIAGSVVALVANIALNVALIPLWGVEGAATATAISYSLTMVMRIVAHARLDEGDGTIRFLLPHRNDIGLVRQALRRTTRATTP